MIAGLILHVRSLSAHICACTVWHGVQPLPILSSLEMMMMMAGWLRSSLTACVCSRQVLPAVSRGEVGWCLALVLKRATLPFASSLPIPDSNVVGGSQHHRIRNRRRRLPPGPPPQARSEVPQAKARCSQYSTGVYHGCSANAESELQPRRLGSSSGYAYNGPCRPLAMLPPSSSKQRGRGSF